MANSNFNGILGATILLESESEHIPHMPGRWPGPEPGPEPQEVLTMIGEVIKTVGNGEVSNFVTEEDSTIKGLSKEENSRSNSARPVDSSDIPSVIVSTPSNASPSDEKLKALVKPPIKWGRSSVIIRYDSSEDDSFHFITEGPERLISPEAVEAVYTWFGNKNGDHLVDAFNEICEENHITVVQIGFQIDSIQESQSDDNVDKYQWKLGGTLSYKKTGDISQEHARTPGEVLAVGQDVIKIEGGDEVSKVEFEKSSTIQKVEGPPLEPKVRIVTNKKSKSKDSKLQHTSRKGTALLRPVAHGFSPLENS